MISKINNNFVEVKFKDFLFFNSQEKSLAKSQLKEYTNQIVLQLFKKNHRPPTSDQTISPISPGFLEFYKNPQVIKDVKDKTVLSLALKIVNFITFGWIKNFIATNTIRSAMIDQINSNIKTIPELFWYSFFVSISIRYFNASISPCSFFDSQHYQSYTDLNSKQILFLLEKCLNFKEIKQEPSIRNNIIQSIQQYIITDYKNDTFGSLAKQHLILMLLKLKTELKKEPSDPDKLKEAEQKYINLLNNQKAELETMQLTDLKTYIYLFVFNKLFFINEKPELLRELTLKQISKTNQTPESYSNSILYKFFLLNFIRSFLKSNQTEAQRLIEYVTSNDPSKKDNLHEMKKSLENLINPIIEDPQTKDIILSLLDKYDNSGLGFTPRVDWFEIASSV